MGALIELKALIQRDEWIPKWDFVPLVVAKLKELGLYGEAIDSIDFAMGLSGLFFEKRDLKSHKVGGLSYKSTGLSTICINTRRPTKQQQFDCMHELIHYIMHPCGGYVHSDDPQLLRIFDIQANWGAVEAKMPLALFIHKHREFRGSVNRLSKYFNVGEGAIGFRVQEIAKGHHYANTKIPSGYSYSFEFGIYDGLLRPVKQADTKNNIIPLMPKTPSTNLTISHKEKHIHKRLIVRNGGEDTIMDTKESCKLYGGFPSNESGQFKWCPVCGFSHSDSDSSGCIICGSPLYNLCSDESCQRPNASYARYCAKCRKPTILFVNGTLWDYVKPKKYSFEEIESLWGKFFDELMVENDELGFMSQLFMPIDWDTNNSRLTLDTEEVLSPEESRDYIELLPKLEWEFSRFINQMLTVILTCKEGAAAEDPWPDLGREINFDDIDLKDIDDIPF